LMNANDSVGLHVGWQIGEDNKIAVSTIDFTALTAIQAGIDITTVENASAAISQIDKNLGSIKTVRANWGAMQNRLDYTVSNLANVNENMAAARSQIQDADFARESANLARIQVLQQAGMAMLGQANQQSQNVLSLVR
ncbi:MAG: flagellin FliC, partial [Thiomicrospira sp.]|uniref:flagellin n=1 Tax=Thiomicrospira sp. TaxID=935 RepID=UPI0019E3E8C1